MTSSDSAVHICSGTALLISSSIFSGSSFFVSPMRPTNPYHIDKRYYGGLIVGKADDHVGGLAAYTLHGGKGVDVVGDLP